MSQQRRFVSPHLLASAGKPIPKAELNELCTRAKAGDKRAKSKVFSSILLFVAQVANRWAKYGEDPDDLFQQGCLWLERALQKYEPGRGLSFMTYAVWWINAGMKNHILENWSQVKLGTTQAQRQLFFLLPVVIAEMAKGTDREPTNEEIADYLGLKLSEVEQARNRMAHRDASLDAPIGGEPDSATFLDNEADPFDLNPEQAYLAMEEQRVRQTAISIALRDLRPREVDIVQSRLIEERSKTLSEIAEEQGFSRERARQLELRGTAHLRRKLQKLN